MEYKTWKDAYEFFNKEYGLVDMSLTSCFGEESVAEITIRGKGLMKLVKDLCLLKSLSKTADLQSQNDLQEEIKYTFEDIMDFTTGG